MDLLKFAVKIQTRRMKDNTFVEVIGELQLAVSQLDDKEAEELVLMMELQANGNDTGDSLYKYPVRVDIHNKE